MSTETTFRIAFLVLLVALLAMRVYFMVKLRRSGGRITPDRQAVEREGRAALALRVVLFFGLIAFLVLYFAGAGWIDAFSFPLPVGLRWAGVLLGLLSVAFWTWTQVTLDTQWSAQLQLRPDHHLLTSGPYARLRHPLYTAMVGWAAGLALLTANWIFVAIAALSAAGLAVRVPREEQMMLEAFGADYQAYMRRAGRFWPRLMK